MTFPSPFVVEFDAGRAQFVADINQQLIRLATETSSPESFKQSADQLQRVMGRLHASVDEGDYLDFRRNLVLLVAECYRAARDRGILTDAAAVAVTDSAQS